MFPARFLKFLSGRKASGDLLRKAIAFTLFSPVSQIGCWDSQFLPQEGQDVAHIRQGTGSDGAETGESGGSAHRTRWRQDVQNTRNGQAAQPRAQGAFCCTCRVVVWPRECVAKCLKLVLFSQKSPPKEEEEEKKEKSEGEGFTDIF